MKGLQFTSGYKNSLKAYFNVRSIYVLCSDESVGVTSFYRNYQTAWAGIKTLVKIN